MKQMAAFAGWLRLSGQAIRRAPRLRSLDFLWNLLRVPYQRVLRFAARSEGLPVKIVGLCLRVHPDFAHLSLETVEQASYQAFIKEMRPGIVVYDVGAHIGTYTLVAALQTGARGCVVAYEPNDETRAYLQQHLVWNRVADRVQVRPMCCGATAGLRTFYFHEAEGMSGLVPVEGFQRRSVMVTTLDEEVAALGLPPNLIKIDVEGAEFDVLQGAEGILRAHRPSLLVSLHPSPLAKLGASPTDVLNWLKRQGYRWQRVSEDYEIHILARPV